VQEAVLPAPEIGFHKLPIVIKTALFMGPEKKCMGSCAEDMAIPQSLLFKLPKTDIPGNISFKNINGIIGTGSLDRIPMVSMCCKNGYDIFNPFAVIGMFQPVDMGEDVRIMTMSLLMTGSVVMMNLVVF
jgi:hypothetical protein